MRLGFTDASRSAARLERLDRLSRHTPLVTDDLLAALSVTADPDLALAGLVGMVEALERGEHDLAAFARTLEVDAGLPAPAHRRARGE